MYSALHGAVGVGLALAGWHIAGPAGVAVASALAFASHDPIDRLGEAGYGALWPATLMWEGVPFAAFVLAAVMAGPLWWVLAAGWIAAMGMDLIDKGRWFAGKPSLFGCHDRAPDVQLSLTQTKALAVVAGAWFVYIASAFA